MRRKEKLRSPATVAFQVWSLKLTRSTLPTRHSRTRIFNLKLTTRPMKLPHSTAWSAPSLVKTTGPFRRVSFSWSTKCPKTEKRRAKSVLKILRNSKRWLTWSEVASKTLRISRTLSKSRLASMILWTRLLSYSSKNKFFKIRYQAAIFKKRWRRLSIRL